MIDFFRFVSFFPLARVRVYRDSRGSLFIVFMFVFVDIRLWIMGGPILLFVCLLVFLLLTFYGNLHFQRVIREI